MRCSIKRPVRSSMHGAVYLAAVAPIYLVMTYASTQSALSNPTHHDIIYLYHDLAVYAIPFLLILSMLLAAVTKPNYDILMRRLAIMYVLKATSQLMTVQPQPGNMDECVDEPIWKLRACADMMFSGHTCFVYLISYKIEHRWFLVFAMAFELVLADWHFMADCFIAVIVGYAIEQKLKDESYL